VFALHINRIASVTLYITFLVVIQLLVSTGITDWATQETCLDCFFGFVSLAIQRLPYFCIPTFSSPAFSSAAFSTPALYQRPLNTQYCIYMSLQKLGNEQLTHCDCEILHSMHIHSWSFGASGPAEITGEVADPCKTRNKHVCFSVLSSGLTPPPPTIKPHHRRRWKKAARRRRRL